MKIKITGIALLLFLALFTLSAEGVDWITDYDTGLKKAQQTGQNLVVLLTAPTWCGYCIKLEEETLPDADVIKMLNNGFIPVMIVDTNPDIKRFDFPGYPTMQIFDSSGKKVSEKVGFSNPERLLKWTFPFAQEPDGDKISDDSNDENIIQPVSKGNADAILAVNKTKIIIFKGKNCLLYDVKRVQPISGYPKPISEVFEGIEGPIDAAVNWNNGFYYLIAGDKYWKISARKLTVESGYPKPFNGDSWNGLGMLLEK